MVDGQFVNEMDSSPEEEAEKVADEPDVNPNEAATMEVNMDHI